MSEKILSETTWSKDDILRKLQTPLTDADSPVVQTSQTETTEPLDWPYRATAAVLAYFATDTLQPFGQTSEATRPQALTSLLGDCSQVRAADGSARWMLRNSSRKEALRRLGSQQSLQAALSANPQRPQTPLQEILDGYIFGNAPAVETQTLEQLNATPQVLDWLQGIVPGLPEPGRLQSALEWQRLIQPFRSLIGNHFRGRQKELEQLGAYFLSGSASHSSLKGSAIRPLLVHGPGGVGKSTLLAKFVLDEVVGQPATPAVEAKASPVMRDGSPPAIPSLGQHLFAYLDFDRSDLLPEEPMTLLVEIVRQLGIQLPQQRKLCEELRQHWLQRMKTGQGERFVMVKQATRGLNTYRGVVQRGVAETNFDRTIYWEEFGDLWQTLGNKTRSFLLLLDTFEEVQYISQDFVVEVWEFLNEFFQRVPALRVVVAGRTVLKNVPFDELKLKELDDEAAAGYLLSKGIRDPTIAQQIIAQVGRSPLSLKLAVGVIDKEGTNAFQSATAEQRSDTLRMADSLLQGHLYRRILGHIHDPAVRKLAHPGLTLRKITPLLILQVLAAPCGITLTGLEQAQQLFDALEREASLVSLGEDGALYHRSDVRRVMLDALRRDEPERVYQIHCRAVEFYQQASDALANDPNGQQRARAEELYHRLFISDMGNPSHKEKLDSRWLLGIEPLLRSAVEEVPHEARPFLLAKLGVTSDEYGWDQAGLEEWERHVETRVRDQMSINHLDAALELLAERKERSANSPLYLLEAQVLERLKRWPEARIVAKEGIYAAAKARNNQNRLDLLLLAARIDEQLGRYQQSREMLEAAEQIEHSFTPEAESLLQLEIATQRLRLHQLDPNGDSLDVAQGQAKIDALLTATRQFIQTQNPGLAVQAVRLVGTSFPTHLQELLSRTTLAMGDAKQRNTLASVLTAWEMQVAAQQKERTGLLARQAGLSVGEDVQNTWSTFLQSASAAELNQALQAILRQYTPPEAVVHAILDLWQPATTPVPRISTSELLIQEISSALLSIFSERSQLEAFCRQRLGVELNQVAPADLYVDVIPKLIGWADQSERLLELLEAAQAEVPQHPTLPGLIERVKSIANAEPNAEPAQVDLGSAVAKTPVITPEPLVKSLSGKIGWIHPVRVVQWALRMRQMTQIVCSVESNNRMGTAFLIGPDLLLTAHYVLDNLEAEQTRAVRLRFDYQTDQYGMLRPGIIYKLAKDAPIAVDETLGFTLMRVEGTPGFDIVPSTQVPRGWAILSSSALLQPDRPLFIVGCNQAGPLMVEPVEITTKRPADPSILSYFIPDSDRIVLTNEMDGSAAGAGGAPIFDDQWNVVAMRYASSDETDGVLISATRIKRILDHPQVAHALSNITERNPLTEVENR